MNILFVARCLPWPPHHGDRVILYQLLPELAARGHACDVVALAQPDDTGEDAARGAAVCRRLDVVREAPRSHLQYLTRLRRPFPRRAAESWNPELWRVVEHRLASQRYDVVHLFGGVTVYEVREAVRSIPSVIVPYESFSLYLERALADRPRLVERVRLRAALTMARAYERRIYEGFDRVVVLAPHDRAALLRLDPSLPIATIGNGVRLPPLRRCPVVPPELLFTGNLSYGPNVRAAVTLVREVWPRVRARVPSVRVVLAGADPAPEVLALRGEGVDVTGPVPDLAPYRARAACFVAPLSRGAGIKNKILEAMAAALPVVTTSIGCEGLEIREGEHLAVGTGAEELAAAVVRLLEDAARAGRLASAGRRLVEARYTWSGVAAAYESLYEAAIDERSRTAG